MTRPARDPVLDAYLRRVRSAVADGIGPPSAVRSIAGALLRARGVEPPDRFGDALLDERLTPAPELVSPWLLGHVHEALLDAEHRRRTGAHYTPPAIARGIVALARDAHVPAPVVCDPAVGGGAFLLAAAESLAAEGLAPVDVVRAHCFGCDVDDVAVDVARSTLALWAGGWPRELDEHIVVADAFAPSAWDGGFDLVIGNPPFQGQLGRRTSRSRTTAAALRTSLGGAVSGYVDTAALFLVRALELTRPGGRVALVQPHSTLAARDAEQVREAVGRLGRVVALWFTEEQAFDAGVRVWAPVVERGAVDDRPVIRRVGVAFAPAPPAPSKRAGEWTELVADLAGIPMPTIRTSGVVGDLATATAGFRDQYYGLVGAVREREVDDDRPRLVTSGLLEVLDTVWGSVDARFASRRWRHPVVAVDGLDDAIARWVHAQLVPKLVVATQTKAIELAVDETGSIVPSTPVIAVHADPDQLWLLAAALSSPPVSALARVRTYGSALSAGALKLSARQVLQLPLPADRGAWEEAARRAQKVPGTSDAARRDALAAFATASCAAYGVDDGGLVEWWLSRVR